MKYVSLLLLSGVFLNATNIKVSDKNVHASPELGKVKLFHNNKDGFKIWREGRMEKITSDNLSSELRSIDKKTLKEYQKSAFIKLGKNSDGEVTASSHVRGTAGGPLLGEALYWGVKGGSYWAIAMASQALIDNVKGVKSGGAYISSPGEHPVNTAIGEGGLPGGAAFALKSVATVGPAMMGTQSLVNAGLLGKRMFTGAAWQCTNHPGIQNINSIGTGPGVMIGYHSPVHSAVFRAPFLAATKTVMPIATVKQVGTWGASAAAGHSFYKEGLMGDAGRAQWNSGMTTAYTSATNSLSDNALTGATLGFGAAAAEGTGSLAGVGFIECAAQTARAWGYAQLWCP